MHEYERGEVNCKKCGKPHEHDWEVKVVTSKEYEFIPDEDFMCHGGWHAVNNFSSITCRNAGCGAFLVQMSR